MLNISLCFCPSPNCVELLDLQVLAGVCVRDVLQQAQRGHTWLSQLQSKYPSYFESSDIEILIEHLSLGIFSKRVRLDYIMQAGDRLEIYRPLLIDPKEARHLRHQLKRNLQKQTTKPDIL